MKVLITTIDQVAQSSLSKMLVANGWECMVATDLPTIFSLVSCDHGIQIIFVDIVSGASISEMLRPHITNRFLYIVALTVSSDDSTPAWADDCLARPVDSETNLSRIRLGERIIKLETACRRLTQELEIASRQVAQLQGFIPICAWCKKIRDDQEYWQEIDDYLQIHCDTAFTHSICPSCLNKKFSEILDLKQ